jgi:hypothetical protein
MAAPRFRVLAWTALPAVVGTLLVFRRFLDFVETRPGPVLDDPVLRLIPPHDVAMVVFSVLHVSIIGGLLSLVPHPHRLVGGLWGYVLLTVSRAAAMFLLPLDPPPTLLPMRDPFVELFGAHGVLTRDLFFSGHTATVVLVALAMPTPRRRALVMAGAVVIGVAVLFQHAHYTIDVLAAPFFAYPCFRAGIGLARRVDGVQHRTADAPSLDHESRSPRSSPGP